MADSVEATALGRMDRLDAGGFGTVYRLASYSMPGFADLAYKEFSATPGPAEVANLTTLVDFRMQLDARSRAILDEAAAWPLRIVTRDGAVCGFVMQLIPAEFFGRQILPSGRTDLLPLKSQWLVVDPDKADAAGIDVPRAHDVPARLVLCAKLAHVLGVLHRAGFVYGDLSLNNVMFSAATPPRVMLVDCDAVQSPGLAPIEQAHTDDWAPPESVSGQQTQDAQTDRYKLALFILRVLTPGPHASQSVDPSRVIGALDFEGNAMMLDGVSTDRNARPSAKDWYECLTRNLSALTSPPSFDSIAVDTKATLAGSMVALSWTITGTTRVTVTASDGHVTECDSQPATGQCRVAVTRSGPFMLSAENRFGTTTVETRPVFVLEPPTVARIEIAPVPVPRVAVGDHGRADVLAGIGAVLPMRDFAPLPSLAIPALPPQVAGNAELEFSALMAAVGTHARDVVRRANRASATAAEVLRPGESVQRSQP